VLTGMISTLLSQGLSPVDAARAGAYWHGLAGRLLASRRRVGVVAGDIPDALADALQLTGIRLTFKGILSATCHGEPVSSRAERSAVEGPA